MTNSWCLVLEWEHHPSLPTKFSLLLCEGSCAGTGGDSVADIKLHGGTGAGLPDRCCLGEQS